MKPYSTDDLLLLEPAHVDTDEDRGGRIALERGLVCLVIVLIGVTFGFPVGSWVDGLLTSVTVALQAVR